MNSNKKSTPFSRVLDNLDKKYSNFDGDGYEEPYYDYIEGAPQENVKIYQADPYQIVVQNLDKVNALKATFLETESFFLNPNLGTLAGFKSPSDNPGLIMLN